ncbi:MAG: hypothetical protein ACREIB_10060, partial [Pseudomonadota bacterium]
VKAVRAAVRGGRQVFARLLDDSVPRVRTTAAHLLGQFSLDAVEHIGWLQAHFARGEPDEQARAHTVLTVGRLGQHAGDVGP